VLEPDLAGAVEKHGGGHQGGAQLLGHGSVRIDQLDEPARRHPCQRGAHQGGIVIDAHRDDRQPARAKFALQLAIITGGCAARLAPSRPEIEQHHAPGNRENFALATETGQLLRTRIEGRMSAAGQQDQKEQASHSAKSRWGTFFTGAVSPEGAAEVNARSSGGAHSRLARAGRRLSVI